ncbi:hypothetical protein L1049_018089 [Liquidambar formosana]|uniref:Uncharacterized protein n=1 Tax=Liquidambar formosana TaxID=63359 RepID=A0AAP0R7P9_LIQFO
MAPPAQSQRTSSPSQPSGKGEVSDLKSQLRQFAGSRAPGADDSKRELVQEGHFIHDDRHRCVVAVRRDGDVLSDVRHCFEENVLSIRWELC